MSKHYVMVNDKYMVSVEANSRCAAEHVILDAFADMINKYGVIFGALAFNREDMAGDFFADCLERCETLSLDGLHAKVSSIALRAESYEEELAEVELCDDAIAAAEEELDRVTELLKSLRKDRKDALNRADSTLNEINRKRRAMGARDEIEREIA